MLSTAIPAPCQQAIAQVLCKMTRTRAKRSGLEGRGNQGEKPSRRSRRFPQKTARSSYHGAKWSDGAARLALAARCGLAIAVGFGHLRLRSCSAGSGVVASERPRRRQRRQLWHGEHRRIAVEGPGLEVAGLSSCPCRVLVLIFFFSPSSPQSDGGLMLLRTLCNFVPPPC